MKLFNSAKINLFRMVLVVSVALISFSTVCKTGHAAYGEDPNASKLLAEGMSTLKSRKPADAIGYFDKVIAIFEAKFKGDHTKFFCVRTSAETLVYLTQSLSSKSSEKTVARVVSSDWAYAHYFKAYALIELGRLREAKLSLERALAFSPRNAQFLLELANVYHREKNWTQALETLRFAETSAREFSPPKIKDTELARSWRGIGYVFIELNRLDEAEKMYQQCLELDKNDLKALAELDYIRNLRAKQRPQ